MLLVSIVCLFIFKEAFLTSTPFITWFMKIGGIFCFEVFRGLSKFVEMGSLAIAGGDFA
jgi:hypothetical protein